MKEHTTSAVRHEKGDIQSLPGARPWRQVYARVQRPPSLAEASHHANSSSDVMLQHSEHERENRPAGTTDEAGTQTDEEKPQTLSSCLK